MSSQIPTPFSAAEVRRAFLDFFVQRGHREVSSHAVIPPDDPTLYFVNAGMVQFKDIFVGAREVDYKTATSCQKCLRVSGKHNDLENVGRTRRHHTLFEMLGNFSFGDYFKEGAIDHAWAFLTEVLGLSADLLHVSVHPEDDEAYALWRDRIGVPPERIHRDPDNFWSMGETGPCGPCSEVYLDQGPEMSGGHDLPFGHPDAEDRYLEIWNLVFMQYDRAPDGTQTPLPKPSIDTGAGLERLVSVLQGKTSSWDTDLFKPLIHKMAERAGVTYGADEETDVALRVIADHSRATAFLIADGVYPDNEGRGYVLRRVMRRAIRFGRMLGLTDPFLVDTTAQVVEEMGQIYPELVAGQEIIYRIVLREEQRFGKTINAGMKRLDEALRRLAEAGEEILLGTLAFELYDTHGFPLDLTELICQEHAVAVDLAGFEVAMEEQRARARAASTFGTGDLTPYRDLAEQGIRTRFIGYETEEGVGTILAMLVDGQRVPQVAAGQRVELVLGETPFYAESGGQIGDTGTISSADAEVAVFDVQRPFGEVVVHCGEVVTGTLLEGHDVTLRVDQDKREAIRRNHSATHLLHHALREVLGDHVKQRGSRVGPDRLRFDFSHTSGLSAEEMVQVEERVNAMVLANQPVVTDLLTMEQAMERGAIAFFEEKYADTVRVLSVGAGSVELCGGTHARATGDIGFFKLISEGAISSGVRRVEGVTGLGAARWVQQRDTLLRMTADRLHVSPDQVVERVEKLLEERKNITAALDAARTRAQLADAATSLSDARHVGEHRLAVVRLEGVSGKELRPLGESLRDKLGSGAVLIVSVAQDKVSLLVAVTRDASERLHAGQMVGALAPLVGGRGGGRPDMAQAGGGDIGGVQAAIDTFYENAAEALEA